MTNSSFSSFPFSVAEVVAGSAILRFVTPSGKFAGYTVQMGGKSFQHLAAARRYAKRIGKK